MDGRVLFGKHLNTQGMRSKRKLKRGGKILPEPFLLWNPEQYSIMAPDSRRVLVMAIHPK